MKHTSGITILSYIIAGLIGIFQAVRVANFVHNDISDALSGFVFAFLIAGLGYLYNKSYEQEKDIKAIEDYLDEVSRK